MGTTRYLYATQIELSPLRERTAIFAELFSGVTHLALDIDGVITAAPKFFRALAREARECGIRVSIVTSRSPDVAVVAATRSELRALRIPFDRLHAIPAMGTSDSCPLATLDWYQQWLWQKVNYCEEAGVELLFDDDEKVVSIAGRFAPTVNVVHVLDGAP